MNNKTCACSLIFTLVLLFFCNVFADDLTVSWNPNTENDLAGYKVYFGTTSRNYSHIIDVGNDTIYTVTGLTPGREYFFAVTAYDTATPSNESAYSEEASYFLAIPDTTPPTLISATLISATQLRVNFSEKVDRAAAETISNYQISNGVVINSAALDTNDQTVTLTTSAHPVGNYTLTVNNIADLADPPNVIAPNSQIDYSFTEQTPFEITEIQVVDTSHIIIVFSKKVETVSAEDIDNYEIIPSISILDANLDPDEYSVHLTTSKHDAGQYALVVSNIQDQSQPPQTIEPRTTIIYQVPDFVPPTVASVVSLSETQVRVNFSEKVDSTTAENVINYQISGGIVILQAQLGADGQSVLLTTTAHNEGSYTLQVQNVTDLANPPNVIQTPNSHSYNYVDQTPPTILSVQAIIDTQIVVTFSEPLDRAAAESITNYQIFNDVQVLSATLDVTEKVVHLITTPHIEAHYILIVQNIKDKAQTPNVIPSDNYWIYNYVDQIPPTLENVEALTDTTVLVTFSEAVDQTSAETTNNYKILFGVNLLTAQLLEANNQVLLTTTQHQPQEYILQVNNIRDRAANPNTIASNTTFVYEYVDQMPPEIVTVNAIDDTHIDVVFNEPINQLSAERIHNYQIQPGISVISAQLDIDEKTVHLTTSSHTEGQYSLIVNDIQDQADPPNSIHENTTFNYEFVDTAPPVLLNVTAVDRDSVLIEFNEPLEVSSATDIVNYQIQNFIEIYQATLDSTGKFVTLVTSAHDEGKIYFLSIQNLKDRAQNPNTISPISNHVYQYEDHKPPIIAAVQAPDADSINIVFNEPVEQTSAENIDNYSISDSITILSATLDTDLVTVHLKTSKHSEQQYTLTVNNVKDRANNPNTIEPNSAVQYEYVDVTKPTIVAVTAPVEDSVHVTFSEPVEKTSAENVSNYSIPGGITIESAVLDADLVTVHLKTSKHSEQQYTLTVNNVKDRANNPNTIKPNSQYTYEFNDHTPPEIIAV
ncbi:MAG: hypothetical protein GXO74_06040, partial [Calditrichaeota bacterium]|nr:hypothetical protein [Calditrichota bacterium]